MNPLSKLRISPLLPSFLEIFNSDHFAKHESDESNHEILTWERQIDEFSFNGSLVA